MADAALVYKGINKNPGVNYPVLVPNMKGFEEALKVGVKEIAVFTAASEAFCKKNINCSIDESIQKFEEIVVAAKKADIKVRGYVSCVMGCPYEGEIEPEVVNKIANTLINMGCYEVSLGDTIGIGTPGMIIYFVNKVFYNIIDKTIKLMETITVPKEKIAAHYHNTYDRAIENLVISMHYGVNVFDSSIAGLGGCPYAKGASGNVATEDVLLMCEILGIETGIKTKDVINLGKYIINEFGYEKRTNVDIEDLEKFDYYRNLLI